MSNPCNTQAPAGLLEALPRMDPPAHEGKKSYGQILKSSALIGGSSVVGIGIGVIRTKAMAVLLGPAGVGLMGLYSSVADLTQSVVGMGLNSSGVRQIAEAAGSGEAERIARTATVLRRVSFLLGAVGAAFLVLFAKPMSVLTFGSARNTAGVALLSVVVLCRSICRPGSAHPGSAAYFRSRQNGGAGGAVRDADQHPVGLLLWRKGNRALADRSCRHVHPHVMVV